MNVFPDKRQVKCIPWLLKTIQGHNWTPSVVVWDWFDRSTRERLKQLLSWHLSVSKPIQSILDIWHNVVVECLASTDTSRCRRWFSRWKTMDNYSLFSDDAKWAPKSFWGWKAHSSIGWSVSCTFQVCLWDDVCQQSTRSFLQRRWKTIWVLFSSVSFTVFVIFFLCFGTGCLPSVRRWE